VSGGADYVFGSFAIATVSALGTTCDTTMWTQIPRVRQLPQLRVGRGVNAQVPRISERIVDSGVE
jgi:hypothetical protein